VRAVSTTPFCLFSLTFSTPPSTLHIISRPFLFFSIVVQHIPRSKEELAAHHSENAPQRIQAQVVMERPEQCFHCRDLQAEFEEVRAQQRVLEDQVRNMEARHAEQIRSLEAKFDE